MVYLINENDKIIKDCIDVMSKNNNNNSLQLLAKLNIDIFKDRISDEYLNLLIHEEYNSLNIDNRDDNYV